MNISPFEFENYRDFLKQTTSSKEKSHRYLSLRRLAKESGISAAYLSRVINGKQRISASAAFRISQSLSLGPEEESHFMRLAMKDRLASGSRVANTVRRRLEKSKKTLSDLSIEKFQVISQWEHFAILALVGTSTFQSSPKWIGQRLGIPAENVRLAIERLVKTELISRKNGRFVLMNNNSLETPHDALSKAIQENHSQHLQLAIAAIRNLPLEKREYENGTFSIKSKHVAKAKKRIRQFMDQFMKDFESSLGDEVFQMNIQFYQLSKN